MDLGKTPRDNDLLTIFVIRLIFISVDIIWKESLTFM